jgi:hypothetical protein
MTLIKVFRNTGCYRGAPRCPDTVGIPRRGNARRQVAGQAKVLVHHEVLHQDHLGFVWLERGWMELLHSHGMLVWLEETWSGAE